MRPIIPPHFQPMFTAGVALIMIVILALATGCQSTPKTIVVDQTKFVVVAPPKNLYNCPQAGKVPDPATATNQDVANFISKLYKFNRICGLNMKAIEKYVANAERVYKK